MRLRNSRNCKQSAKLFSPYLTAADEGITGTSVAKRDDFQRMMADCRRGLIDQILVKSISRFARNTKDCLQNIRELKELGVNVRFEREGIDTVNVSSELITAIYAAFAQKESESILADNNEQAKANQRIQDAAQTLENASPHITEWDESAVRQLVETVKVLSKDEIAITLKGGIEICQKIMY